MDIIVMNKDNIKLQKDLSYFVNIIYTNFIELAHEEKLMHTREKIEENLRNDNSIIILIMTKDKKLVGFLTANVMMLDDRRKVFFVTYIYVSETYRNKQIGSKLLDEAEKIGRKYKCNGVMLIYDTSKTNLVRFYEDRSYMQDINLRRYEQHDVFYKIL
jgi:ribosomal protein S18 acetylase RimI-like enzyme